MLRVVGHVSPAISTAPVSAQVTGKGNQTIVHYSNVGGRDPIRVKNGSQKEKLICVALRSLLS